MTAVKPLVLGSEGHPCNIQSGDAIPVDAGGTGVTTAVALAAVVGDILYPVGCIIELTVATNPSALFGFGTWASYGAGRVSVCIDTSQTEFNAGGKTGGAKTHALTTAEMPVHTHTQNAHSHAYKINIPHTDGDIVTSVEYLNNVLLSYGTARRRYIDSTDSQTATNQNTGGGAAHNNLQPYVTVYRWTRTA